MTENASPPRSTNRWYSILGFQFSRRQAIRAALLLAVGGLAFCLAFAAWYIPPRATSRLIRSVGGWVQYRPEHIPNMFVARFLLQPTRMVGLTATDEEVEDVQLVQSKVTDDWLHHLKLLEGLRHLHIHERQLGPGLTDLAELPELSTIAVWHLRTGDLSHLQRLPNLGGVSLVQSDCSGIDLSQLALLSRLTLLQFPSTTLTARQFEQISQIKTLHQLGMYSANMDAVGHEGIAQLANLPSLQILQLHKATDTAAEAIAKIESLTYLSIENCMLTDKGAASLAKLRNLKDLSLQGCDNPLDVDALRKLMPGCRINYRYFPFRTR